MLKSPTTSVIDTFCSDHSLAKYSMIRFTRQKKGETNKTVLFWVRDLRSIIDNCFCKRELLEVWQPLWTYPKTSITWNEWSDFDVAQDDDDVPIPEVDDEFAIIPPIPGGPPGPPPPPPTRKLLPPPLTPLAPTKPLLEEWGRLGWGWTWCWKGNQLLISKAKILPGNPRVPVR